MPWVNKPVFVVVFIMIDNYIIIYTYIEINFTYIRDELYIFLVKIVS